MPPNVALALGILLVAGTFYLQRPRAAKTSTALFWPTLWYLIVATCPAGLWLVRWNIPLPGGAGDATDGSIVDRYFYLTLSVIGLRVLSKRRFQWGSAFRDNPWLVALLAYMALSILWSSYPFVSFKRFIKVAGSIVMALVVLTEGAPLESLLTVLRRCLYIHLPMSIICIKYFRDIGVTYDWDGTAVMWQGIATSKNTLGQVAMLGVLCFLWDIRKHWKQWGWRNISFLYLFMAAYLLKGSEQAISLTSVSVAVLAVVVFFTMQTLRNRPQPVRRFVRITFAGTVALVALVLLHSVVMFSQQSIFGQIITKFGRNITLTDRTFIWSDCYAAASGNPLFGVGFGGFWIGRIANIPWNATMTWILGQAHNGYVDTYLQLGWVGAFLLAGLLFTTLPRLLSSLAGDFDFGCFRITLFIVILFINITETTYLRGDHNLWFVMQFVLWDLPARRRSVAATVLRDDPGVRPSVAPVPA